MHSGATFDLYARWTISLEAVSTIRPSGMQRLICSFSRSQRSEGSFSRSASFSFYFVRPALNLFVSSVRSSSVYHGLLEGSAAQQPLFQIFQILQIRK